MLLRGCRTAVSDLVPELNTYFPKKTSPPEFYGVTQLKSLAEDKNAVRVEFMLILEIAFKLKAIYIVYFHAS